MKEVVGTRDYHYGEFERFRPGQDVGQRNRGVAASVNDQRVLGDCAGVIVASPFNMACGGAHQHQALCGLTGFGQCQGYPGLYVGAKRKTGKNYWQFSEDTSCFIENDEHVLAFPFAFVMLTTAGADPAEIRAQDRISQSDEGARQCVCNLVFVGSAKQRVRMADERNAAWF